jgi:Ca2+-binding EF-hand superfamily protein
MRRLACLALAALALTACGASRASLPSGALPRPEDRRGPASERAAPRPLTAIAARSDAGLRAGVVALRTQRFERLDQNHDGAIARDEATDQALALPGVVSGFADYDADHDGAITLAEFLREDVIAWWSTEIRFKVRELFQKLDRNGDMQLVGAEREKVTLFFSTHPQLHGGDLDQDGRVTFTEFEDAYMVVLPIYQPPPPSADALPKLRL